NHFRIREFVRLRTPIAKSGLPVLSIRTWRLPSIVDIPLPQPTESVVTFDLDPVRLRTQVGKLDRKGSVYR
ncbi:TPA: hypothetical protein ACUUBI_006153, partial [Pseudomonas aeruginosa]